MRQSKFINTEYKKSVNSLIETVKSKLNNPYYNYTDMSPTIVDYYNLNTTESTLDVATRQNYSNIGDDSPFRFNLIKDALVYGVDQISLNYDLDDYGLNAGDISGEFVILPNTFIPMENDYFKIKHIKENLLFKVIKVDKDTLDTGDNLYKVEYKLDLYDDDRIDDQVVSKYQMMMNNYGTNYKTIIKDEDYNLIEKLDNITADLKVYFKELFFENKLQTFIVSDKGYLIYDSLLIEFIKKNELLYGNSSEFIHIDHATSVSKTFSIEYDNSIFRAIESKSIYKFENTDRYYMKEINDINSLFVMRAGKYYQLTKIRHKEDMYIVFDQIDKHIKDQILKDDNFKKENVIWGVLSNFIRYENYTLSDIDKIVDEFDFKSDKESYYLIPILIYIIESYIKELL